ncbi:hypothetical protein THOG05_80007 [Vibrio rotiferianus]|nr:hypothetical protein THOG05_80007 [Vibrio rotiferianus]
MNQLICTWSYRLSKQGEFYETVIKRNIVINHAPGVRISSNYKYLQVDDT